MSDIYSEEYVEFRRRLIQARKDAGMTQVQVAKAIGKPQPFISKIEQGERRVDVVELAKLARLYNRPLDYFSPYSTN